MCECVGVSVWIRGCTCESVCRCAWGCLCECGGDVFLCVHTNTEIHAVPRR